MQMDDSDSDTRSEPDKNSEDEDESHFPQDIFNPSDTERQSESVTRDTTVTTPREAKRPGTRVLKAESAKKAKLAKHQAIMAWSEHLAASTRRLPIATEARIAEGPQPTSIHETHSLWLLNCITFCKKCGYWQQLRETNLRFICPGRPLNAQYRMGLRWMQRGYHPRRSKAVPIDWPDGSSGSTPCEPVKLY